MIDRLSRVSQMAHAVRLDTAPSAPLISPEVAPWLALGGLCLLAVGLSFIAIPRERRSDKPKNPSRPIGK